MSYLLGKKVAKIRNYKKQLINAGFALLFAASLATGIGPLVEQAFADTPPATTTYTYNFNDYEGAASWTGAANTGIWYLSGESYYHGSTSCGLDVNCVKFFTNGSEALLSNSLSAGQTMQSVSFTLHQVTAGGTDSGLQIIEQATGHADKRLPSIDGNYKTSQTGVQLDAWATSLIFKMVKPVNGNNLALDDVALTLNNSSTPNPSVDFNPGSFGTRDAMSSLGFKGINVGFTTHNFTHVDGITVQLMHGSFVQVTNTAAPALLADINNQQDGFGQNGGLSTTFITDGSYTDTWCGGEACWNSNTGNYVWDQNSPMPTSAVVTVTQNGVSYSDSIYPLVETAGASYDSILPVTRYVSSTGSDFGRDCSYQTNPCATINYAVSQANSGDTINLESNLTVTSQQTVDKPVTFNGNGHTITANSGSYAHAPLEILNADVTINDLTVDANNLPASGPLAMHAINVFTGSGHTPNTVNLNDVTAMNGDYGIVVNGANVSVNNLMTSDNFYAGVDVDRESDAASPTTLTISGTSHHDDGLLDGIYVDDSTDVDIVNYQSQYTLSYPGAFPVVGDRPNDEAYTLKPVDTTPPAVPSLYRPANNSIIRPGDATLNWNDVTDPNGPVTYWYESSYVNTTNQSDNSFTSLRYGPHSTGTASQIDATGSASHVYYWQVRACDSVGNCSDWSGPWKVTIDGERPKVSDFKIDNQAAVYSDQIKVSAKASDNFGPANVKFYLTSPTDRSGTLVCTGNETHLLDAGGVLNQVTGRYEASFDTSNLNGQYCVNVLAEDIATNHSNPILRQMVTVDNTAPQVTFTSPADGEIVGDTNVSFDITDANNIAEYKFHITGPNGLSWDTYPKRPNTKSVSVADYNLCAEARANGCPDESKLPSGTYHVQLIAYDGYGNDSRTQPGIDFALDNDGPTVSITNPAKDSTVNNVLVDGTVSDQRLGNGYFNIQLWKVGDSNWNFTTQKQYVPANQTTYTLSNFDLLAAAWYGTCDGQPCYSWNHSASLPDGQYIIRVNAYDQFGNRTIYSHKFTLTRDTTGPTLTLVTPTDGADIAGDAPFELKVVPTGGTITSVDYTLTNPAWGSTTGSGNLTFDSVSGDYTGHPSAVLANGSYHVVFTATDSDGNTSTVEADFTIGATGVLGKCTPYPACANGQTGDNDSQGNGNNSKGKTDDSDSDSLQGSEGSDLVASLTGDNDSLLNSDGSSNKSDKGSQDGSGHTKGDQGNLNTNKNKEASATGAFLGLGWWWLPILAALIVFFATLFTRANNSKA